ncbi:MAG: type II toxin-antitoxin system HicA family toxin [Candidatus Micrarchaeia archaeon]|jgi:predicted RNA binding protein YcfA (HicA-like mRNA interferase family)
MKLRPIPVKKAIALLKKLGYNEVRQRGSHLIMQNGKGRIIVVPIHTKEIGVGLLRAIIRELGLSREAYFSAFDKV